jgi:hypothetical protein
VNCTGRVPPSLIAELVNLNSDAVSSEDEIPDGAVVVTPVTTVVVDLVSDNDDCEQAVNTSTATATSDVVNAVLRLIFNTRATYDTNVRAQ